MTSEAEILAKLDAITAMVMALSTSTKLRRTQSPARSAADSKLLKAKAAAREYGLSTKTLKRRWQQGLIRRLQYRKNGDSFYYREDLDQLIRGEPAARNHMAKQKPARLRD